MQQVNTYRGCTATVTPQVAYAGEKGRWCVEVSLHRPLSPGAGGFFPLHILLLTNRTGRIPR